MLQELLASRRSMADRFRGGGFSPAGSAPAEGVHGGLSQRSIARPELPTPFALELLRDAGDDVRGWTWRRSASGCCCRAATAGRGGVAAQADADVFESSA